jgi:hypothetical protein
VADGHNNAGTGACSGARGSGVGVVGRRAGRPLLSLGQVIKTGMNRGPCCGAGWTRPEGISEFTMPKYFQDELLEQHLRTHLGDLDPAAMAFLRSRLEWVEIAAGETLMAQGDPTDSMYISISGRLRSYVKDDNGNTWSARWRGGRSSAR